MGKVLTVVCGFADFLDVCLGDWRGDLNILRVEMSPELINKIWDISNMWGIPSSSSCNIDGLVISFQCLDPVFLARHLLRPHVIEVYLDHVLPKVIRAKRNKHDFCVLI